MQICEKPRDDVGLHVLGMKVQQKNPKLMWVLHFQIRSSLNYFESRFDGFHKSSCEDIASYKVILRT
jgi:hypothetical protein